MGLFQRDLHQEPQPLPSTEASDARLSGRSQGCLGRLVPVPGAPAVTGSLPSSWDTASLPPSGSFQCPFNTLVGLPYSLFLLCI